MKPEDQFALYPAFAPLDLDSDLGQLIITAEPEDDCRHEVIGIACTLREAAALCQSDAAARLAAVERGACPMAPYRYLAHNRRVGGWMAIGELFF